MNEKLSFQNVSDALALKANVSKKVAESFTKAFFDTVVEALYMGEDSIKVKGLGTFKLVEVDSRESVNVSNGERILIPGYKKVAFTPEDSVVERLSLSREEDVEGKESVEVPVAETVADGTAKEDSATEDSATEDTVAEGSVVEDIVAEDIVAEDSAAEKPALEERGAETLVTDDAEIEDLIQVPEPEHVEQRQDEFAGIDMLISTPESVDEVRQQYEDAKAKLDAVVEEARKANAEKVRLERLLERLEANAVPEAQEEVMGASDAETPVDEEKTPARESLAETSPAQSEVADGMAEARPAPAADEDKRQEAFNRYIQEPPTSADDVAEQGGRRSWWKPTFITLVVLLLLAAIVFFLYRTSESIESVEKVIPVEQPVKPVAPVRKGTTSSPAKEQDSVDVILQKEETKELETTAPEPARPKTYTMQKGESLTRISQRFYGTKDSVNAIIRANAFPDPDNVPIGAVITLP